MDNKMGVRRGTRIPCEIPITLTSADPAHSFSEQCLIILVNAEERAAFVAAAGDGNPEIEHEVLSREDRPIRAKGVSRQGRDGAVCFCLAFLPILPTGFRRAGYCRKHC